jgi:DUF4097 and DUF4098 domain-containing protein YvlB
MIARASLLALLVVAPLAAHAATEQTFTKTINLHDKLNLEIVSAAGSIQISAGPAGQLTVTGHVKANDWHATDDRLRDIAANPPIRQDLDVIRVGVAQDPPHVIIDYEIEAPAGSIVHAASSLGDIFDDGVGESAAFTTGAGSIHATGMQGNIDAASKSGDIEVEQFGRGDVKAISISGNLDLRNLRGALHAATGDGKITVFGAPGADWSLQTGNGDIDLALGRAACNLDAQSKTGSVLSELRVDGESSPDSNHDPHHLVGKINGGGHTVTVVAGDGVIRIH